VQVSCCRLERWQLTGRRRRSIVERLKMQRTRSSECSLHECVSHSMRFHACRGRVERAMQTACNLARRQKTGHFGVDTTQHRQTRRDDCHLSRRVGDVNWLISPYCKEGFTVAELNGTKLQLNSVQFGSREPSLNAFRLVRCLADYYQFIRPMGSDATILTRCELDISGAATARTILTAYID